MYLQRAPSETINYLIPKRNHNNIIIIYNINNFNILNGKSETEAVCCNESYSEIR